MRDRGDQYMGHIVLFEPNKEIADSIRSAFSRNKIKCETATTINALDLSLEGAAEFENCDAILVGGVENQSEFVRSFRQSGCAVPIIGLLDHRNSEATIRLLSAGADDVLIKPISPLEVMARIKAVVRRGFGHSSGQIQIGQITAYLDGRDPEVNGQRIKLSHREYSIFTELALRVGKVVSKESLYDTIYGMMASQPYDKVIDVYICKLRKKLASYTGGAEYIETVYGRGYKLEAPKSERSDVKLSVVAKKNADAALKRAS